VSRKHKTLAHVACLACGPLLMHILRQGRAHLVVRGERSRTV